MKRPAHESFWNPEIEALYRHDLQEIWDPTINRHIWNQYHNQLDLYLRLAGPARQKSPKKILDVGCAQGTLALLLAENGHDVVALDLRPSFLTYARSRYTHGEIRFVAGNVLQCPLSERFDFVFANQIIEHVVHPDQFIRTLKDLLNETGKLVVTTPNWHYLRSALPSFDELGDPSRFEHLQFTADGDGHFFAYTPKELERIFRNAGFASVERYFFELPFISGHMKLRHLHQVVPEGLLRALDRASLASPVGRYLAHQLMIVGRQ